MRKCKVMSGGRTYEEDDLKNAWRDYQKKPIIVQALIIVHPFEVETLEGTMRGNAGDYLIKGIDGELYPCKPNIFHKTYDIKYPSTQRDVKISLLKGDFAEEK